MTAKTNTKKNSVKKAAENATKRSTRTAKVDELKLGKFASAEPMRLPERRAGRSWQIIGGIALLLISGYCVAMMIMNVPFVYLAQGGVGLWGEEQWPLTLSWIVNNVALILFTIICLMTSIMMFAGKRVAMGVWYVLILLLVTGFVSQSIGIYENYTTRECVTETCPMVVGELAVVLLCDLIILMMSVVLLWVVHRLNKAMYRCKKPAR